MLLQKWDEMLKDGFMETGDVMEQRGPNTVVWIDRKKNIMKLSQVTTPCVLRHHQPIPCQRRYNTPLAPSCIGKVVA